MAHIRSFTDNRSTPFLVLAGVLIGLAALAALSRVAGPMSIVGRSAPGIASGELRAQAAYQARWEGLAGQFASELAEAARWQGLADSYAADLALAGRSAGLAELASRSVIAYTARWTGLAQSHAATQADSARWSGIARYYASGHSMPWGAARQP
jgi:hypothetical protein